MTLLRYLNFSVINNFILKDILTLDWQNSLLKCYILEMKLIFKKLPPLTYCLSVSTLISVIQSLLSFIYTAVCFLNFSVCPTTH